MANQHLLLLHVHKWLATLGVPRTAIVGYVLKREYRRHPKYGITIYTTHGVLHHSIDGLWETIRATRAKKKTPTQ